MCGSRPRPGKRQDISLSGTGLIEPFIGSSTDVYVSANRAFGALASYRFMLTPSSAIEATTHHYQNNIRFKSNSVTIRRADAYQEISGATSALQFRKYNPFVEAGRAHSSSCPFATPGPWEYALEVKQQTAIGGVYGAGVAYEISPASTFAPSFAAWSPGATSASPVWPPTSGTTSTIRCSAWPITSRRFRIRADFGIVKWLFLRNALGSRILETAGSNSVGALDRSCEKGMGLRPSLFSAAKSEPAAFFQSRKTSHARACSEAGPSAKWSSGRALSGSMIAAPRSRCSQVVYSQEKSPARIIKACGR